MSLQTACEFAAKEPKEPIDANILIVDDQPTVRESVRYVLAAGGIRRIVEATTALEAVGVLREQAVDLVLIDVALRDGKGLDALCEIKSVVPTVPVLIHSYHDYPRLLFLGHALQAAGYVVKGLDKNDLLGSVKRALAGESTWTSEQLRRMQGAVEGLEECPEVWSP